MTIDVHATRAALGAALGAREIVVDGLPLACDDTGRGPAIVCLHAIGHGAGDFRALGRRLAARHRVIALDWPGHGRSGDDREAPAAARYAALAAGALDALDVGRAVVVGNSIGGAAAIRLAAARPDRVRGLVLENPGGFDPADRTARTAVAGMVRFFAAGARGAAWFPTAYALYYRLVLQRAAAADQRRRIVAAGREMAPVLRDAWRGFGAPEADLRGLAATIRLPILFAWAVRDQIIQLRRCLPAIERLASARLERFPAGHAPHLETPDAFATSVERFVGALPA
jgi:4,5:9,10-diseco-3-hydroxy-5,9,17-trioxoandrosta-1(10),2-diene-4-oate hydrolase